MSKKSLLTESEIARFKELAGIPLSKKDSKILSENKWGSVVEEKEEELDEAVEEEEEGEEEEMEDEGAEEGAEDEEVEVEMGGEEEGGEEELDMDMGGEDLDMGAEGGDAEALVTDLLSRISKLAKMVGVSLDIEGGEEHAEPDEDNMGGPSDMDADNMEDEEEMEEEEELQEGDGQMPFDAQNRRPDDRAPQGISESSLRQITQRVAARMNGVSATYKNRIVETVTNRVAARLIAEAKKAKKGGIKEKMHAKKKLKEGSKGGASKDAPKGNGPGSKSYGVKGKVANEYSLKSVKLPKNSGGQDTVVAKGGKAKTVPQGAGKKGGKGNTTN